MSAPARALLASRAAALLAVDPAGLGGAWLRGPVSATRDAWEGALRGTLAASPWRRMPPQIAEGRLVGGLDLAATLAAGRPVAERGLVADADGGVLVVPMAERLGGSAAGLLAAALDTGEVIVERDGLALRAPAKFAALLLDEGEGDERAPSTLTERVGLAVDLVGLRPDDIVAPDPAALAGARARLADIVVPDEVVEALAAAGPAFGVPSLRLATFALRAAAISAAIAGRRRIAAEDAELAAALVIAPRATRLPATEPDAFEPQPDDTPRPESDVDAEQGEPGDEKPLADSVVEAARAAIPPDLLALLARGAAAHGRASPGGRGGAAQPSAKRGRPAGTRRGQPGHGLRLAVVETLRAAAPWQRLRRAAAAAPPGRILVRRDDFRIGRFKQRNESVTIFVVDASGSAALHRLAEVKGAVELILADCYVRRDGVALVAFRGQGAELILPPTRSLTRAKRALAGQAGGGGTPLAAAIEAAALLAARVTRAGQTPLVVLMTDGKANIARDGRPGRAQAEIDAAAAARAFRLGGAGAILLDIAPRPSEAAARLAHDMGASYVPLPYADARAVSRVVQASGSDVRGNVSRRGGV